MQPMTQAPTTTAELTPAQAYEQYFGPAIFEPLTSVVLDRAALQSGEHVLDLACGTGIVTRRIPAAVGPAGRVVGVDIQPAMLDVARAQPVPGGPPIDWRQGDATALELPDATFDVVLCQQGLQFFSDRAAGVGEMRRVLRDGGRAVLAVWQGLERHPLYAAIAEAELPHLQELGAAVTEADLITPFTLGDEVELRDLLAGAGFRHIDVASRSITARFSTPDRFIARMEFAYAAVVPQFAQDPSAFASYLRKIERAAAGIVERHRDGNHIVTPMHAHIAVARA